MSAYTRTYVCICVKYIHTRTHVVDEAERGRMQDLASDVEFGVCHDHLSGTKLGYY